MATKPAAMRMTRSTVFCRTHFECGTESARKTRTMRGTTTKAAEKEEREAKEARLPKVAKVAAREVRARARAARTGKEAKGKGKGKAKVAPMDQPRLVAWTSSPAAPRASPL